MPNTPKFVWFELNASDADAAKAFYTETLGWGTTSMDMGNGAYQMLTAHDKPQAGVIAPQDGVPNHWSTYFEVSDVDKAAKRVKAQGGKILVPPTDIPNVGRFSLAQDPQGGTFNLFKSADSSGGSTEFHWVELWTKDTTAAVSFYTKVLEAESSAMDTPEGPYHTLNAGDSRVGGIKGSDDPKIPTMWLPYVAVKDCDQTVERAGNNGGSTKFGPITMPGIGRFAILLDKVGAAIGVITPQAQS